MYTIRNAEKEFTTSNKSVCFLKERKIWEECLLLLIMKILAESACEVRTRPAITRAKTQAVGTITIKMKKTFIGK